ncbi:MAG TPA: stage VI sporulation protein F [Bacillus bacterium]|nr:stage VI sporulation protein F [Bacillus sp. (in: firmicutes)]
MGEFEFKHKELFDKIEDKTNIKSADLFALADSVKEANFADENTVRKLIKQLSTLANIPVSENLENSIVESFINQNVQLDFHLIGEMTEKISGG